MYAWRFEQLDFSSFKNLFGKHVNLTTDMAICTNNDFRLTLFLRIFLMSWA
jgi:hypothetical protein